MGHNMGERVSDITTTSARNSSNSEYQEENNISSSVLIRVWGPASFLGQNSVPLHQERINWQSEATQGVIRTENRTRDSSGQTIEQVWGQEMSKEEF